MARIYDNIEINFTEGLRGIISNTGVKNVDFCVGYFNLRGWGIIVDEIDLLPGDFIFEKDERIFRTCRLLIGMHRPPEELIRQIYSSFQNSTIDAEGVKKCKRQIAAEFKKQLILGVPSARDEWTLRRLSSQLKNGKVCVKLYLKEPLHAKLYLAHRPDDHFNKIQAIMGSSNLTYSGLSRQGELNAEFGDSDSAEKLSVWFNNRWEDRYCIDITEELHSIIDNSWASETRTPPYHIYLKTVYHLSQEARSGINEYVLPPEFKEELFEFQATAVKLAARHLDKRGGAMIGDVVGLGKTMTACAVAKVYEMRNSCNTLILCPANLQKMWKKYIVKYDLKADVMSISKKLDYKYMKYYRLVIIDESHNLRNSNGTRYKNIKEFIEYHGSKVLLLTATPYNKDFSDLSNQLKLFLADDLDLGIQPEAYIRSIGGTREFAKNHEDFVRSIKAFERSTHHDDWRELMRLFLVRRTRTFIKDNYALTDTINNRKYLKFKDGSRSYFPERFPRSITFPTIIGDQFSRLYSQDMIDLMATLRLPRYGLNKYISEKKSIEATNTEQQILDNLSRAGARMMGFCRTNFFKRLDSSGISFLISIYRHILRNSIFLYAVENKLPLPIGDECVLPDGYNDDDNFDASLFDYDNSDIKKEVVNDGIAFCTDSEEYKKIGEKYYNIISAENRGHVSWINSKYFTRTLKQHLKNDNDTLIKIIELCGVWKPETDQKLNALEELITSTHKEKKAIIFTQFSDTAYYIDKQLRDRGIENTGRVTGATRNPTDMVERFSPISNQVEYTIPIEEQYRILVATDVLSEGQNLQDSHIIINYDLPWAIIRLIQRAGRVDRIGQQSEEIYCYSFFPADGIEKIINLRNRLNDRINESANVVGGDEIFFEGNEKNLIDIYNEKNGALDEEDDGDVDLASQAFQIWKSATEANPLFKKIIPELSNVVYSTKANNQNAINEGVITYAKTPEGNDMLTWMGRNKHIITQSQYTILKALSCSINEEAIDPHSEHHDIVRGSIDLMQQQEFRTSGILGSRLSTKRRLYNLLDGYCKREEGSLFLSDDVKLAVDDIYNYPLRENAKYILGQQLKRGTKVEDIVDLVVELRKNDELCIINEDENTNKDPQIICSMGLRNI